MTDTPQPKGAAESGSDAPPCYASLNLRDHIPDATKKVEADYYAVYVKRSAKDRGTFLLHVHAKGKPEALRITRAHGHSLPRWSYAVHIGKAGYYAALRHAFPA